jgi:hypothetical protein
MSQAELAVQGLTLVVTGGGPGTATVTGSPSTKLKADGHGVYKKQLDISISGCVNGDCTQSAPKTDSIMATATKVKCEDDYVMRKGDKKQGIIITGTTSLGAGCSFPVDVEITNAGQTRTKGE